MPTRIYVRSVLGLLDQGVPIRGMAHITGGGIAGNLSRVIPDGLSAQINMSNMNVPVVFRSIQDLGGISDAEMMRVFNMGVGFVLVIPEALERTAVKLLADAGERPLPLGRIVKGAEKVVLGGVL